MYVAYNFQVAQRIYSSFSERILYMPYLNPKEREAILKFPWQAPSLAARYSGMAFLKGYLLIIWEHGVWKIMERIKNV